MTPILPYIAPLGDAALLVTFADVISRDVAHDVLQLADRITQCDISGITDIVPAYTTLAVYYEAPLSYETLQEHVTGLLHERGVVAPRPSRIVVIPVWYDGADLESVAESTGLSVAEVIACHTRPSYTVYMLGFVPGFAYLGELDPALVLPRRATPRQRVPRGAVAIAGAQTAVYPLETPGGWHLLGTTPTVMFDAHRDPPTVLRPGDTVRFEAMLEERA